MMKLIKVHENLRKMGNEATGMERRALRTACVCVEKNIPKKTMIEVRSTDTKIGPCVIFKAGTTVHRCPRCKMPVTGANHYCGNCGQRIKWGEKK